MAKKSNRGFASMSKERRKQIASSGGKAAHQNGRAHKFSKEEAKVAGHRGGVAVSRDRAHMARIGRKGGIKSRPTKPAPAAVDLSILEQ